MRLSEHGDLPVDPGADQVAFVHAVHGSERHDHVEVGGIRERVMTLRRALGLHLVLHEFETALDQAVADEAGSAAAVLVLDDEGSHPLHRTNVPSLRSGHDDHR